MIRLLPCIIPIPKWRRAFRNLINKSKTEATARYKRLAAAIADPNGYGLLELMVHNAKIPKQHNHKLYEMQEGDICIDCGANVGLVSDIIIKLGGFCYAFEPALDAVSLLNRKYAGNKNIEIIPAAVSDKNGTATFNTNGGFNQGAHLVTDSAQSSCNAYQVKTVRLVSFIQELLNKHKNIFMIKIDIEGAEFDVLEDIIQSGVYKNIKYIFVETHEWWFKNLKPRLEHVKGLLADKHIENIYLDWV
jgi:FkbM family methyltransferase